MDREKLYYVLYEQQEDFKEKKNLIPRELTADVLSLFHLKMPIIITGVRRSGKSTLLKILSEELHMREKSILYINFNDERLISFSEEDFQKILDFLVEQKYAPQSCLSIDEIQEVEKWEKWVDRIKGKHPIVITGSNSKLLSKEISTILTGRSMSVVLFPFSFKEFLCARKIETEKFTIDINVQSQIRKELVSYLNEGGLPSRVVYGDKRICEELYENIIYRDIIKRFNPNLEKAIKEVSLFLLSNTSKKVSLRNLSKTVGVANLSTMKAIFGAFENAFLFFSVQKYDSSVKKQLQNPKKIYCIDNGFIAAKSFQLSPDYGKLYENIVAISLKRKELEGKLQFYYWKDQQSHEEVDFVVKKGLKVTELIQVCYNHNNPKTKEREARALLRASKELKCSNLLIITQDKESEETFSWFGTTRKIRFVPLWKWLLGEKEKK